MTGKRNDSIHRRPSQPQEDMSDTLLDPSLRMILDQYKEKVCESHAKVRPLPLMRSFMGDIDIEDIYVDLQCEPFVTHQGEVCVLSCSDALLLDEDDLNRRQKLNMVILGLPGSGKTTLLKYLLKRYSLQSRVVPVYVELKSEICGGFKNLLDKGSTVSLQDIQHYMNNYFVAKIGARDGERLVNEICNNIGSGEYEIIFFCDGLDEISVEQYRAFTAVANHASSIEGCKFIISSRQIGFFSDDYDDNFRIFSLLDFDEKAQKKFIEKYFSKFTSQKYIDYKNKLIQILDSQSNMVISKLAKSPILLSLICVTPDIDNIKSKAQLFQNAINTLLFNRNIKQREAQELFIEFLKDLAVVFFKLDKAECFDDKELEFYAERFCNEHANNPYCGQLKNNYLNCGLFDKSEKANSYKFAHRTIWEYLVAVGMQGRDRDEIYSRSNMAVWEEPIKMFVSLIGLPEAKEVIENIWNENKALALNCMNEFVPFPTDILDKLYGGLARREKLSLIATLRNSYVHYNGSYKTPIVNTINETLALIHTVEKDCEVVYSYLEFLTEFSKEERIFSTLLANFLQLDKMDARRQLLKSYGLEFVKVEPGKFYMGRNVLNSPDGHAKQNGKYIVVDAYEIPEHPVRISSPYWISKTLITNKMYFESGFPYCDISHKSNPYSNTPNQPVNFVNWYEAMVFAKWIGCTLPSETEWEYACRGGEGGSDFMTDNLEDLKIQLDQKVNYAGDKTNRTRPVIPINPQFSNSLGLVDMIGNLREWCIDWFDEEFYLKCSVDSYPSYKMDILGKTQVSYFWRKDVDGVRRPYLLDENEVAQDMTVFTFDDKGYCVDPVQSSIEKIEAKSLRGGCFDWSISNLRPTYRNHNPANNVYKVNGFRLIYKEEIK